MLCLYVVIDSYVMSDSAAAAEEERNKTVFHHFDRERLEVSPLLQSLCCASQISHKV